MHLDIPQTQIGRDETLGILGTEEIGDGKNRVQLILSLRSYDPGYRAEILNQCEAELGIQIGDSYIHHFIGGGGRKTTASFFLPINGTLRNPQGFLKAVARRIGRAIEQARREHDAQLAAEAGDTEEWCALMGAPKSLLNKM